ncbi:hypothetical protein ANN_08022 [Periplaneta americana]|uniref:Uncharacterized protein n=1 Tax=Periplaneta americana TaxID=6978 RepID=A0ABQ8T1M4_PERAM|nr:hypothetical protein ANN_08022 [Periplaneta americana]
MAGLCEGDNEPPGSLKASKVTKSISTLHFMAEKTSGHFKSCYRSGLVYFESPRVNEELRELMLFDNNFMLNIDLIKVIWYLHHSQHAKLRFQMAPNSIKMKPKEWKTEISVRDWNEDVVEALQNRRAQEMCKKIKGWRLR